MVTEAPGTLAGVRVLELAEGVAGPYCGKLLAGLGAEVIKVEPPGRGDVVRGRGPFAGNWPDREASALFLHLNTGKRGMTLDYTSPHGRALLYELVRRWADVVVDSSPPRAAAALGVDWPSLKAVKEDIILTSVTYFGYSGPYRDYAGCELVALALGGYLYLTGDPDAEPLKPYGFQAEYHAGLHGAAGTVGAILLRETSGLGEHVDVSVVEAASFLASAAPGWYHFYGKLAGRSGNRLANPDPKLFYPSTIRPCRDGWVHAHNNTRHQDLLGVLIPDPRLVDPEVLESPMAHADEIDQIMDCWLADKDRHDVVEQAQSLRLPFTEVFGPEEVLENEHLESRGTLITLDHPVVGPGRYPHAPVQFHETPWMTARAPLLGEHTQEILDQILGLAAEDIEELQRVGVL